MDRFPKFDELCNEVKNTPLPPLSEAMLDAYAEDFDKETFENSKRTVRRANHVLSYC